MIELLTNNHFERILDLFDSVMGEIKIISPFLTTSMAEKLCEVVRQKKVSCRFITRFYLEDMIARANSMDALEVMLDSGICVYLAKGLHTKLYLFDHDSAILGSANFTSGGFKSNLELSLLLTEHEMIAEFHAYFDRMAESLNHAEEGRLTKELLSRARSRYSALYSSKRDKGTTRSTQMYGAALDKKSVFSSTDGLLKELQTCDGEEDLVCALFREQERVRQIHYPYTIWLKFDGEGNNRLAGDQPFPMTAVTENGHTLYLSNYPYRVRTVKDGDEVYLAGLTTDKRGKNQPVIIGRGHLAGFRDQNTASEEMLRQYSWMERYPWYCVITDCEVLNAPLKEGIPMDTIWGALGSDTYIASFGRGEDSAAVERKHYQKAHMRLSGNAKRYIDKKLDQLKAVHGVIHYQSG